MNFTGLIIGVSVFLLIGLFHPIVIKAEYYFGKRVWWVFGVTGLASMAGSILAQDLCLSLFLGVFSMVCLWSIPELFQQEQRVKKGWFPKNPKRRYPFE